MRPTARTLWAFTALAASAMIPVWVSEAALPWWMLAAVTAAALIVLAAFTWRVPVPRIERRVPLSLPHGASSTVRVRLNNESQRACRLSIHDHHPPSFLADPLPQTVTIPASGFCEIRYTVTPHTRGKQRFGAVDMLIDGRLGFWQRRIQVPAAMEVHVYPNFAAVSQYRLLAAANRAGQLGIRRRRRRGEGMELHQLREYRPGDTLRQIDWKATARRGSLISREYEVERDQTVLFLLDCGRRMRADDETGTHLDHALNAVLLLSYVALRQGDSVGLVTFGSNDRFLSPVKGRLAMRSVLNAVYDLESSTAAPDYTAAAERLTRLHNRRALVIVISNLRDEDQSELLPALSLLQRRHLVVMASLREKALDEALDTPIRTLDEALLVSATHQYLGARRQLHESLVMRGVQLLDLLPAELPVRLVNRYLEIKSAGVL
ncbi:MAG: DUF58 domain-containing protein [Acidobacteriota bacterium]